MLLLNEYILVAIAIFFLLCIYFRANSNYWKNKNIPFAPPVPIFGNVMIMKTILMRQSIGEALCELYQSTLEPVLGFFILNKPCLLIRDPVIIKRILNTDFQHFTDRSLVSNKESDPVGTSGLVFLKYPEWRDVRPKISPLFTLSKIKTISLFMEQNANEMIDYANNKIEKNSVVEIKEVCMKFTVNVITSTLLGVDGQCFKNEQSQFWIMAKKIINWDDFLSSFRMRCFLLCEPLVKLFKMTAFDPVSTEFFRNTFLEIANQRSGSTHHRNVLVDLLLDMKSKDKHIEDDLLAAQVFLFFTSGFESSSLTAAFALYEMARNSEVQAKLRNEINAVSEKRGGINYDSLKKMTFLDMCVKEVWRKYPILPFVERNCKTDYIIPETGTAIDKGTSVFVSLLGLHYDPQYFPHPDKFDPERFSPDNIHKICNFTYLPFGEGPRICIGANYGLMKVKYCVSNLLKNFVFEPCPDTPLKIRYNPNGVTLAAHEGIKLQVKKIET